MNAEYCGSLLTPIGQLEIRSDGSALTAICLGSDVPPDAKSCKIIRKAQRQLEEYFCGARKSFSLELKMCGTDFQLAVWSELQKIEYGSTRSYAEIARSIGRPKAARPVGGACHQNPLLIVIPCHRVIGQDRSLTGFGGGLAVKEWLLKLETR